MRINAVTGGVRTIVVCSAVPGGAASGREAVLPGAGSSGASRGSIE